MLTLSRLGCSFAAALTGFLGSPLGPGRAIEVLALGVSKKVCIFGVPGVFGAGASLVGVTILGVTGLDGRVLGVRSLGVPILGGFASALETPG